jgi:predicted peroxiredoxin
MSDKPDKLVIIATHAEESADKATIPFVMGSTALAMDVDVSIILQATGVYLALKGYADHVHAAGFPPLEVIAGATLVSEALSATNVVSY